MTRMKRRPARFRARNHIQLQPRAANRTKIVTTRKRKKMKRKRRLKPPVERSSGQQQRRS
jgi:hypothetical protein